MFERILVPLDRSPLAECVLPHAVAVARSLDSQLMLLHILSLSDKQDGLRAVDPLEWQLRRAEAESYLEGVRTRLEEVGVAAQTKVLNGDAAEQILAFARENQIGLAVISSHGQSGLSGWNVSSVVQKVILRAPISLMIVRAYLPAQPDLGGLRYRRIVVPLDAIVQDGAETYVFEQNDGHFDRRAVRVASALLEEATSLSLYFSGLTEVTS